MKWWIACAAGFVGLAAGFVLDERDAVFAYLAAFSFLTSVLVGALTLALIGRLAEGRWYVDAARAPTEAAVATIPLLAIFFFPIALASPQLYPVSHGSDAWPFFVARSFLYLGVWALLAHFLPRSPRKTSAVGLILVGFTVVAAAFDWLMALEPAWSSTIFGVYFWSGGFLAALGLAVLAGRPHADLAKLILTASIFWAYVAYDQALVIWIAAEPRETAWYLVRTRGLSGLVLALTVLAKLVLPFFALLPYDWKRRERVQLGASAIVIAGQALDVGWLVLPEAPFGIAAAVLYAAALVALSGFVLGVASSRREVVPT